MSSYAFIAAGTELCPVQVLYCLLVVGTAGYYQWRQRPASVLAPWLAAAQQIFARHAARYRTRRLPAEFRVEARRGPLRPALLAAPSGLTRFERPVTAPAHDGGRYRFDLLLGWTENRYDPVDDQHRCLQPAVARLAGAVRT